MTNEPGKAAEVVPQSSSRDELNLALMLGATVVLLITVGIIIWLVSATPLGNAVVVTVRNP